MRTPNSSKTLSILLLLAFVTLSSSGQISFTRNFSQPPAQVTGDSRGVSWIDVNGDSFDDLFITRSAGQTDLVFINDGDGDLIRSTSGDFVQAARSNNGQCWADYDNDGDADLFTTGGSGSVLFTNDGTGNLSSTNFLTIFGISLATGWACAWGDMDRDGWVDLVITHPAGFVGGTITSNWLFRNRGDGKFERLTSTPVDDVFAPFTIPTWYDFDLDGDLDLFIGSGPATNSPGPDNVYVNQLVETGTFSLVKQTSGPIANGLRDGQVINWIDVDNDRDLDAFITNWGGGLGGGLADELFRNNNGVMVKDQNNPLTNATFVSLGQAWGDYDNDGDLDVFIAEGSTNRPNQIFSNDGQGIFTRVNSASVNAAIAASWGIAAGDYDNDGDLDVAVANTGSSVAPNYLFINDYAGSNSWLKVKLQGATSNRAGIGARVHIQTTEGNDKKWQVRDVSSQNSFNGMNSLVQHFGLGSATVVDSLVVEWPSGMVTSIRQIMPNQRLDIIEGRLVTAVEPGNEIPVEVRPLQVYPNPVRIGDSIQIPSMDASVRRVYFMDILGRTFSVDDSHRGGNFVVSDLNPGSYLLVVERLTGRQAAPVVILR
ncbi:MAG: FG-GAP-like repeat-containing protein [Bacteroidetes bacterium]|nr:FG-GAP-like repeat-containing protein [Bacteroidota bacterium]